MTVRASRIRHLHDDAAEVVLRDVEDGAETATATEAGVELPLLAPAHWVTDRLPDGSVEIALTVTALDKSNGDETYKLDVLVDDTQDMSNAPIVIATVSPKAVGSFVAAVDFNDVRVLYQNPADGVRYIAVRTALGGTSPSITYGATMVRTS